MTAEPPLTITDALALPTVVDLATAARALGLGRTTAYALARAGEFPCRLVRIGALYRVPTADLLRALGLDPHTPTATVASPVTDVPGDGPRPPRPYRVVKGRRSRA